MTIVNNYRKLGHLSMNLSSYNSYLFIIFLYFLNPTKSDNLTEDERYNEFEQSFHDSQSVRVELNYGTFIGTRFIGYERFTGIPYAEPPLGDLRLRNPIPPRKYYKDLNVQHRPPSCLQQAITAGSSYWLTLFTAAMTRFRSVPFFAPLVEGREDCLTLDVYRPAGVSPSDKLPVMFFICAFVLGGTYTYPGKELILKSMEIGKPIIYVTANYRLNAFGFLGGKEVGEAGIGNLGLKDQRLALKWVQKHINRFGGDPKKVTVFGQSAGAMSISYHLMINNGNLDGLFRAAITESGTALHSGDLRKDGGQKAYDTISKELGCNLELDSLSCIRNSSYEAILDAQNKVSGFLSLDYYPPNFTPFVDGSFITESPRDAFDNGRFAKVPMINGCQDDEGTAMGFGQISLITDEKLEKFLKKLMKNATNDQLKTILDLYPNDIRLGSPFNTGELNSITPVFKRYSALIGDFVFQSLRRRFSRIAQSQMPLWGYLDRGFKDTPILGSFHLSELLSVFGFTKTSRTNDFQSRWISFTNDLNPNVNGLPYWSKYGDGKGRLMRFGLLGSERMINDDFREDGIGFLAENDGYLIV
ncbi:lipase [Melampsora americana]|nr:lipase [Melampsora americana]